MDRIGYSVMWGITVAMEVPASFFFEGPRTRARRRGLTDLQRPLGLGPITATLPTFGPNVG